MFLSELHLNPFVVLHLTVPFCLVLVLLLISSKPVHRTQVSELHVLCAFVMSDQHHVRQFLLLVQLVHFLYSAS